MTDPAYFQWLEDQVEILSTRVNALTKLLDGEGQTEVVKALRTVDQRIAEKDLEVEGMKAAALEHKKRHKMERDRADEMERRFRDLWNDVADSGYAGRFENHRPDESEPPEPMSMHEELEVRIKSGQDGGCQQCGSSKHLNVVGGEIICQDCLFKVRCKECGRVLKNERDKCRCKEDGLGAFIDAVST
jgi:hypothetical protein